MGLCVEEAEVELVIKHDSAEETTNAVSIKGIAGFKLIGATVKAEALEPPTEGKTGRRRDKALQDNMAKCTRGSDWPSREELGEWQGWP